MHAITTANNALSALIDNHLHQGNELGIDQRRILWKRVVDLNDRALRHVTVGLGGPLNGIPRGWFRYYCCFRNHGYSLLGDGY